MKKLLLHCCCAPCANQPLEFLAEAGYNLQIYYANSNIQPPAEYELRCATLQRYADMRGLAMTESAYRPVAWLEAVSAAAGVWPLHSTNSADSKATVEHFNSDNLDNLDKRRERCRLCYRFRFQELAAAAQARQIPLIASTLAISPYQFQDIMAEELARAAAAYDREFLFEDWRPWYRRGQERARELGFYRQNYCGCEFSRQEAELEREARRVERRQGRAQTSDVGTVQPGTSRVNQPAAASGAGED